MKNPWNTIQDNYNYTNLEIRRIQYTLKVIGFELSKMIMMFFIFLIFGKAKEYLISLLVLCSLRAFSGGAHMKHYWTCFLCSLFVLSLSVCFFPLLPLPEYSISLSTGLCMVITYYIGPIPSKQRPTINYVVWKKFRFCSTVILFIYWVITILFPNYHYLDIVCGTIIVQTIQLVITNILQKGDRYEKTIEQKVGKNSL